MHTANYIRVDIPGDIYGLHEFVPVPAATITAAVVAISKHPMAGFIYGFRFISRKEHVEYEAGRTFELHGDWSSPGPMHWLDAAVFDADGAAAQPWCSRFLSARMLRGEFSRVVKPARGWPQPFEPNDLLVDTREILAGIEDGDSHAPS